MSNNNKKKGKPIRGKTTPYHIPLYNSLLYSLTNGIPLFNDAYLFRTLYKKLTADRLRVAARQAGVYSPLEASNEILSFLQNNPRYKDIANFISCFLTYYNDPRQCDARVNMKASPSSNQKSSGRNRKKTIVRGVKDMQVTYYRDVRKVLKALEQSRALSDEQLQIIGKYRSISRSVGFIALLFLNLYAIPLPKKLTQAQFKRAFSADERICNYYRLEGNTYQKTERSNKAAALCINNRAATLLFLSRITQ